MADRLADPATELIPWCQSTGSATIAKWLGTELAQLAPEIDPIATQSGASIVTKSPTHRQFIDQFADSEIYSLLADDGHVAKAADELGRMGAHRVWFGHVPDEYAAENFGLVHR